MSPLNSAGENTNKKPPSPAAKLPDLLKILFPIFSLYRGRLLVGFAALLGVDFLQLLIPRFLKSAVDSLSTASATSASLLTISCYILLIAAGVGLLRFVWRYMIIGFSRFLERYLRNRIFGHILLMDRPFFEKWTTGNIMAHASNDLSAVQMACGMGMVAAVDALVMSTAAICFMLFINVKLTLIALLPMPFLVVCTRILSGRLHHRFNLVQEQFSLLTEFSRTTLVSIKLIKGYTLERLQEREFERLGKQYVRSNLKVATIQGLLFPIATMVGNTGMLFVLYFGGKLVVSGAISLGDFVAFMTYLYMLVWPIMAVGWVANLAQRGITSLRRVHKLLQDRPYLKDVEQESLQPIEHAVFHLRGLTFAYPAARDPALRDIDLKIGPGILGVAGRTGSGKSTLCKLLIRLYPVDDGCLFFGGQDVNTLSLDTVRSRIGYVGQEPVLFSDTISANIALGKPEASTGDIEAAARAAAIHDDIMGFADRYEARIGERGVKLSGGQRQRIALARALLCDRPVLIIDDALSAIDVETEQQVLAGIRQYLHNRTVLIVSHRINVLRSTDQIILLDQGVVVDQGRHEELITKNSLYRAMETKQLTDA